MMSLSKSTLTGRGHRNATNKDQDMGYAPKKRGWGEDTRMEEKTLLLFISVLQKVPERFSEEVNWT